MAIPRTVKALMFLTKNGNIADSERPLVASTIAGFSLPSRRKSPAGFEELSEIIEDRLNESGRRWGRDVEAN